VYVKSYIDNSFADVYVKSYVDNSFADVYVKSYIDDSFNNVYTKLQIDSSFNNRLASLSGDIIPLNDICYNLGSINKRWANAYIHDLSVINIDVSVNLNPLFTDTGSLGTNSKQWNIAYIKDISGVVNINGQPYVSGNNINLENVITNINPLTNNTGSLGIDGKNWGNAYIRDLSVINIDVSVNLNPLFTDTGSLGTNSKLWNSAYIKDISGVVNINGQPYGAGNNINLENVITNINPLTNNTGSLGIDGKNWGNAYIRDLSVGSIDVSVNLNVTGATRLDRLYVEHDISFGGSTLYVPSTFTIDPDGYDNNTGIVIINGSLQVLGTTTTINSSVVDISDKMIVLASNALNSSQADGAGFEISGANVRFTYNNTLKTFESSTGISISGNLNPLNNHSLGESNKLWTNAYIHNLNVGSIDISVNLGGAAFTTFTNKIDDSFNDVYVKSYIDDSFNDVYVKSYIDDSFNNVYVKSYIDDSFNDIYVKSYIDDSFNNVYVKSYIDDSFNDIYVKSYIDDSFNNVYVKSYIDDSFNNMYVKSYIDDSFNNVYVKSYIDDSFTNVYTKLQIDSSFNNRLASISGDLIPLNDICYNLGSNNKRWANAYINDLSVTNISVSGNIVPLFTLSGGLGTITNQWNSAYIKDISGVVNINGQPYIPGVNLENTITNIIPLNNNNGSLGLASRKWGNAYINDLSVSSIDVSVNLNPLNNNSGNLGNPLKYWGNAYIRDLSAGNISVSGNIIFNVSGGSIINVNRLTAPLSVNSITTTNIIYQELSGDTSWNAVNGYYGLAKDAYPALNPYSIGDKIVSSFTLRETTTTYYGLCWSPKFKLFASTWENKIVISYNGINWTIINTDMPNNNYRGEIIWCQELEIFVIANYHNTMGVSSNLINWTITSIPNNSLMSNICWAPELRLIIAGQTRNSYIVTSHNGGASWNQLTLGSGLVFLAMCWSAELKILLVISTSGLVYNSRNGINWSTQASLGDFYWTGVCWSKQVGLFVAVSINGPPSVRTSPDGIIWTSRTVPSPTRQWGQVIWAPEIGLFIAVASNATNQPIITSPNGINWTTRTVPSRAVNPFYGNLFSSCWCPELGIFVIRSDYGYFTSSFKGRLPTSYNVFDNSFNSIDDNGNWSFLNLSITTANISSLNPLLSTGSKLGTIVKPWTNGYITTLSVNSIDTNNINIPEALKITAVEDTFTRLGQIIPAEGTVDKAGWAVAINATGDIIAIGCPFNVGGTRGGLVRVYRYTSPTWVQIGLDIDGEANGDRAGWSLSLNGDGTIVAIGAPYNYYGTGQVRIYRWDNTAWIQRGIDLDGTGSPAYFFGGSGLNYNTQTTASPGTAVSLSSDGNIVAIGASSSWPGGESPGGPGLIRVYKWDNVSWTKIGGDISGTDPQGFGHSVSLNSDGTVVGFGSASYDAAGIVQVYKWNNVNWVKRGLNINPEATDDLAGASVSINAIGDIIAVGARLNNGAGSDAGHVRVYKWTNDISWIQQGLDIDGDSPNEQFGTSVSLNAAGNILAVGSPLYDGFLSKSGAIKVYKWNNVAWVKQFKTIEGLTAGESAGWALALNALGTRVVVGSPKALLSGTNSAGYSMVYEYSVIKNAYAGYGSITSLTNNTYTLGTSDNIWSNAYIRDISVTNISVSGNIISNNITTRFNNIDISLNILKTKYDAIDISLNTLKSDFDSSAIVISAKFKNIDISLTNVYTKGGNLIPSAPNTYNLGDTNTYWNNAFINNLTIGSSYGIADKIYVYGNIKTGSMYPLTNQGYDIGDGGTRWGSFYINYIDLAANINPAHGYSTLGSDGRNFSKVYSDEVYIGRSDGANPGKIYFGGTTSDLEYSLCTIEARRYATDASERSELLLFKGNDFADEYGPDRIRLKAGAIAFDTYTSTQTTSIQTGESIRMFITSTGNVGINTTTPNERLVVNGNITPSSPLSGTLGSNTNYWKNAYIGDISATNISVTGNVLPRNTSSQVPVSYSSFALKNSGLLSDLGDASNIWLSPVNYDISKNVLSRNSYIKMEFKVNYISSTEADQTLSFRVLKNRTNGNWSDNSSVVFSDLSLGSSMGVTSTSIYNGTFIDDLKGETIESNNVYYRLEYMRNCPVGDSISVNFGIQSGGNYIFLQELYRP
jgi:hypothetical protein